MKRLAFMLAVLCSLSTPTAAQPQPARQIPRVVLVGDSIRLGYAPLVAERLAGRAEVVSAEANGGDSANVLKNLEEWVIGRKPDIVHLNAGLHDLKLSRASKAHQVELSLYESNLREIVRRIVAGTGASVVFASTTPILDARHARRGADFDRHEADVVRYNAAAVAVMKELGVPVNDLHWVVERNGPEEMLREDGTHYTPEGYGRLADAVSDSLLRQITIRKYRPLAAPPSGPEAAAEYRRIEAERDALVPAPYRDVRVPEFPLPPSAAVWQSRRPEVHNVVEASLGLLPPRPSPLAARVVTREIRPGYTLERVVLPNGVDGDISALLLVPEKLSRPAPAVLWLHSSTPDKTQIIIPNTNGGAEPLGEAFVKAGYVVLSPDAYWHGDRTDDGPAGSAESGRASQESLFKHNLWFGRTLWGMFVRDDRIALDYLASRPEVDPRRIGATGMSMGSTRAWWLAAVDDRISAVVAVACLTRYQNLIRHGQLRQHGVYYFVDGLLRHFDTEAVLALLAPRPFLALTGDLDAGSPVDGIRDLERILGRLYGTLRSGERFRNVVYPDLGHAYTPEMRREMLAWFARWLDPSR